MEVIHFKSYLLIYSTASTVAAVITFRRPQDIAQLFWWITSARHLNLLFTSMCAFTQKQRVKYRVEGFSLDFNHSLPLPAASCPAHDTCFSADSLQNAQRNYLIIDLTLSDPRAISAKIDLHCMKRSQWRKTVVARPRRQPSDVYVHKRLAFLIDRDSFSRILWGAVNKLRDHEMWCVIESFYESSLDSEIICNWKISKLMNDAQHVPLPWHNGSGDL